MSSFIGGGGGGGQTTWDAVVDAAGTGDYTDVQSAIDAGALSIFIMDGTYTLSASITIKASNTQLVGESRGGTIITQANSANINLITTNGNWTHCVIANLKLDGNQANVTDGDGITSGNVVSDWLVDHVWFKDIEKVGVEFTGGTSKRNQITNCNFSGTGWSLGISTAGDDYIIDNNNFDINLQCIASSGENAIIANNNCSSSGSSGINITVNGNYSTVIGNRSEGAANSISCGGDYVTIIGNSLYNTGQSMIMVNGVYNTVSGNALDGNGNAEQGAIRVTAQSSSITGNVIENVSYEAIYITGADHCTVTGNSIKDAGTATDDTYAGILLTGTATYNTVSSNAIYSVAANKIKYGVSEAAAADDYNIISGNVIEGAQTSSMLIQGIHSQVSGNSPQDSVQEKKVMYMKNTSGGALAAGDVVVLKAAAGGNEVTTTTTAGDSKVYGMSLDAPADAAFGYVQVLGKTALLKVDGTDDIAIGDLLTTFTTAGIAQKGATGEVAFAMALEGYTTDDSNGVIDALLISPRQVE